MVYSLWRENSCLQDFRSVARFGLSGQESASKPPQAVCKPLANIEMEKLISILITAFFFSSCGSSSNKVDRDEGLTEGVKKDTVNSEEFIGKMLMTSSSNMEPSLDIELYSCDFTIVLNKSGDTTLWSTEDSSFRTPEGFHVGTKWNELPIELQNSVNKIPGWGYYVRLNSHWQLGFCEGESCTDSKPKDESSVKWIFKRND
ncbi:MAG: hypothetical protein CL843_16905 [Crocinitomicaceae bacterium]|nr:hypothetical protein [Crocinitomicaceae bacterium]|tara:strand:+ start:1368 stop:1973 length:606 start_codon:yes stop_codon:yes gene_type:complete